MAYHQSELSTHYDTLRYNKVIVATDADVDGMHIRLLIITFFLQFFPELIKKGHVYVLQTPLFRVRNRRTKIKNKGVLEEEDKRIAEPPRCQNLFRGRVSCQCSSVSLTDDEQVVYCFVHRLKVLEPGK